MNFLITGAQFKNKGAQALLFTAMNEIYNNFSDAVIYYLPLDGAASYPENTYKFNLVFDDLRPDDYKKTSLDFLRALFRRAKQKSKIKARNDVCFLSKIMPKIDCVLDVSGYTLSSSHEKAGVNRYLRRINLADKTGAKVFLLPQSFGPFNYKENSNEIKRISDALSKAELIFAREEEGKSLLYKMGLAEKTVVSSDAVLQGSEIDIKNIYSDKPEFSVVELQTSNNVGIIPNKMLLTKVKEQDLLLLYKQIIDELISLNKNVYVLRHSNDLSLCKSICEMYKGNEKVHLIENEFNSFEYSKFIKQFDFIIASRYHSIVHAYKQYVPAVLLGWAVKYNDLADKLNQHGYAFDVLSAVNSKEDVIKAVNGMAINFSAESEKIKTSLNDIKKENCFSKCFERLNYGE